MLRPMREHGSEVLHVHRNNKARWDGQPSMATSTFTQLLNHEVLEPDDDDEVMLNVLRCRLTY